nr:hypothetical protein [Tanacetum cinerariifolium]
ERILKLIQAWDEKQLELWSLPELLPQLLNDSRTIDEMLKQCEQAANLAVQKEQEEDAIQRDIHFLEELLSNDSIPLPGYKSSNFDHDDDPSFPRPPPKPPDVEVFFDFEPNSGELISAVMNNIDELNDDECFDPMGGEVDVFSNIEDDDYFPFIFVIRIFLPYLTYPKVSPLLLSTRSEDIIFDPYISI